MNMMRDHVASKSVNTSAGDQAIKRNDAMRQGCRTGKEKDEVVQARHSQGSHVKWGSSVFWHQLSALGLTS